MPASTLPARTALFGPRPDIFAEEILGVTLWPHQRAPLMALAREGARRIAVRSCNSVGKDFLAACATLWAGAVFPDVRVVTTGPTFDQLRDVVWGREIHNLYQQARVPLPGRLLDTEWDISPVRWAGARSVNTKESLSGRHAQRVIIIVDEAAAREIGEPIWEAIDTLASSGEATIFAIGNPTRQEGKFYRIFHEEADEWERFHISAHDTPNLQACAVLGAHEVPHGCAIVQPGLITHEWVEDMLRLHGAESDFVRVHVLGEFPESGADNVIPLAWVEAAIRRGYDAQPAGTGLVAAGLDVARKGADMNALVAGRDNMVYSLQEWSEPNLMATVGRTKRTIYELGIQVIAVDDTGVGGGVVDALLEDEELPCQVLPVNFGTKADNTFAFHNKPSEMWWRLRENMDPACALPLALKGEAGLLSRLSAQLTRARYTHDSLGMGRKWVDKHGKIGERRSAEEPDPESPDLADALCLMLEAWSAYHDQAGEERTYYGESFLGRR